MNRSTMPVRTTVIMPAYNAAATIENTVRSVLNQNRRNLTLIVVDDGSTDETWEMLNRLRAEDERLIPVAIKNAGPANARNAALDIIPEDTEYLMFCDADDYLEPDALSYAIENARDADLVIMGYSIQNADGSSADYCEPEASYEIDELGSSLGRLYKANLLNQVWGKLYKADIIQRNHIRFQDWRWGEDRLFIYDCLDYVKRVTVLPECKYRYVMHPGESLITRYYDKKLDICILADKRMEELCKRFGVQEESDFRYMFMKGVFSCMTTLFSPKCTLSVHQKRNEIYRTVNDQRVLSRSRNVFGGTAVKTLCSIIRTKNVTLNYWAFYLVAWAGKIAPRLFTKLKHKK